MTPSSNRRAALVESVGAMRAVVDRIVALDTATTLSKLDPVTRERLAEPRMMQRLGMRRARGLAPDGLFSEPSGERESFVLNAGPESVEALTVLAGVHTLWEDVIRIVQRREREELDAQMGIDARATALRGREHAVGIVPLRNTAPEVSLAERILREGAMCWACWVSGQPAVSARRLRVLTPDSVAKRIAGSGPISADERRKRRVVVDLEIGEMMRARRSDNDNSGGAA